MIPSLWPWLLVAAMSGASGAAIAWRIASDRGEARRMQCEQAREHDARAAAEQATALLARSQDAQVQATRGLAQAHAARQRRLQETQHAVHTLTAGRECLSGPVRLRLNAAIAGADHLPASAGSADAAAAAAASDTDIAAWVIEATARYDACRERLDALRTWDSATFDAGDRP